MSVRVFVKAASMERGYKNIRSIIRFAEVVHHTLFDLPLFNSLYSKYL